MSNYHVQMLPGLDEPDLYDVQGYYQAVLDMPYWDYKSVGNFIYAGIKIYCGSSAFVPHLGDWLDTTSGYMVVLRSRPGIPGTNICGERLGTTILGRMSIQDLRGKDLKRDVAILIMCDGSLIKVRGADVVRSDDNKLDAASFAMVKRKGMLNRHQAMMSWKVTDDSPTQTGLAHVWSVTLLHELFHYILDYEMYPTYNQLWEIYGWRDCSEILSIGPDEYGYRHSSKHNPDSLALYAAALKVVDLDSDLLIWFGYLGSRTQTMANWERDRRGDSFSM